MDTEETTKITPEVKEVTETKQEAEATEFSLADRLAQATELKPEIKANASEKPQEAKTENNSFWGSDNDFEPLPKSEVNQGKPAVNQNSESGKPSENKSISPITDTAIKQSAEMATAMVDITTTMIFTGITNIRHKKKFTKPELKRALDIEDGLIKESELNEEDRILKQRYERSLKKRDSIIKDIPFTDKEEKQQTEAWARYFKIKQIELPPSAHIAFALANQIGNRVLDQLID